MNPYLTDIPPPPLHTPRTPTPTHTWCHTPPPSTTQDAGITLEDLQEMGVIGSGSSGIVKRVQHKRTRATYVLKVINFDVGNELLRKQITTELKTLYGAQHPHIVQYHQSYFANGAITILMEHMDAGSLYDLLLKVGPGAEGADSSGAWLDITVGVTPREEGQRHGAAADSLAETHSSIRRRPRSSSSTPASGGRDRLWPQEQP